MSSSCVVEEGDGNNRLRNHLAINLFRMGSSLQVVAISSFIYLLTSVAEVENN